MTTVPLTTYTVVTNRASDPEPPSDVTERVQKALARSLEETVWAIMTGGSRHQPSPVAIRAAIRAARDSRLFETVELDATGDVIEPPPRCHCTVYHRADCPNRFLGVT